jgi:hypothetical protein
MTSIVIDIDDKIIKHGIGGTLNYITDNLVNAPQILHNYKNIEQIIFCKSPYSSAIKIPPNINYVREIDRELLSLYGLGKTSGLIINVQNIIKMVVYYDSYRLEGTVQYLHISAEISDICESIQKIIGIVDIDLRKVIVNNIIIIGKHAINNLGEKLIDNLNNKYVYTIFTPKNWVDLPWIGGSVLSQTSFI